jgi:hypothetical protein
MKAYKVTLLIIDHDELGSEGITEEIQNIRYPNNCISPSVMCIEERDIGEWTDNHPLNGTDSDQEFDRLFGNA